MTKLEFAQKLMLQPFNGAMFYDAKTAIAETDKVFAAYGKDHKDHKNGAFVSYLILAAIFCWYVASLL